MSLQEYQGSLENFTAKKEKKRKKKKAFYILLNDTLGENTPQDKQKFDFTITKSINARWKVVKLRYHGMINL